jgi:hypothetical protein
MYTYLGSGDPKSADEATAECKRELPILLDPERSLSFCFLSFFLSSKPFLDDECFASGLTGLVSESSKSWLFLVLRSMEARGADPNLDPID